MADKERWWSRLAEERFWLESTDREDLGVDLRAPLHDEAGRDNWRYTLFLEARVGDVVFHYDKRAAAITSASRIAAPAVPAPIVWAARGSYARTRGAEPSELAGYRLALSDHHQLSAPLTLETLRRDREQLQAIYDAMVPHSVSKYFPFELSSRPVRPLQGYAFKLPSAFVETFLPLWDDEENPQRSARFVEQQAKQVDTAPEVLRLETGRELTDRRWTKATTHARTFAVQLRHAEIQRRLKSELLAEGCIDVLLEPMIGSRMIDVVAIHDDAMWFYEVKTNCSDRACLRDAIGQLLEYALWPGATRPERLVVVGEPPLTANGKAYLATLNAAFPVPIGYRQLLLS
ncbi:hypothetical protein [Caulobacter sp. LjRoot300]|uniref:hypothetical protein n=1 Tax=Caulobacter sp. LjRoot300 TaxID=3342321 RepID=UPI003ECD9093